MGRIKTTPIKRATRNLLKMYGDKFKDNFEENKRIIGEFASIPCKKLRNSIVGYITRLKSKEKEKG